MPDIIDFLDKSRSAMSRTRTTSHAPAPALRPATVAFSTKTKTIVDALHSEEGNPNHLTYVNARNEAALRALTADKLPVLTRIHRALTQYISDAEQNKLQVSVKTKTFWQGKKAAVAALLAVIENGQQADAELTGDTLRDREQFYAEAQKSWEVSLKDVVLKVNSEVIGPYSLGDQLSIADLHLASWLARLVKLSGGGYEDDGDAAIGKLEAHIGGEFGLAKDFEAENAQGKGVRHSKLGAFWDIVTASLLRTFRATGTFGGGKTVAAGGQFPAEGDDGTAVSSDFSNAGQDALSGIHSFPVNPSQSAYCSNPHLTAQFDPYPSSSAPYPFQPADTSSTKPPPFPPTNLDSLSPAGVFVGVFSVDSSFERRMLVRTTWATHPRSREGAGDGDGGVGTSRTIVRFILGQPRKDWERRIKLEMETFNDIIILPISENMNNGKTHTFFSWAAINAWVPPVYSNTSVSPPLFSYSNHTASPPALAPHDSGYAWQDLYTGTPQSWVRPDYVVKADDDSFVMLAELEARLRVELHTRPQSHHGRTPEFPTMLRTETSVAPKNTSTGSHESAELERPLSMAAAPQVVDDPLVYWGYLVTNRLHKFMAGELYALSWSLVDWAAKDPAVKGVTRGAEDKQTAKWMTLHPRSNEVRWASERCWIYDHPRSGTVYSHGFLYPSEATRIKRSMMSYMDKTFIEVLTSPLGGTAPSIPAAWSYSTVSTFGVRYVSPLPDLSIRHSVEALVEGSDMSMIREGSPMTPEYAWTHREGRRKRYEGKRVGGTVVVHFIKKNIWYLETALALLDGEEQSEFEKFQSQEIEKALARTPAQSQSHMTTRRASRTQHRLS
ncbi:hypothetical protein C0991_000201 [Blastosporella zonata]|nr:hypothetical protein C0991_000201 [Blastosporella zonata]